MSSLVNSPTKKPRKARFFSRTAPKTRFFFDSVTVNTVVHTESESCQKRASHGDRDKEGRGSERRHAGTGEGISARIHVANAHGDRAEEGRRNDRRHSVNSLWERDDSCMLVGTSIVVVYVGVGGVRGSTEVGSRQESRNEGETS